MSLRRLGEQFESLAKQDHAARLAMWVFLASEILLFAALFALYTSYRAMYPDDFARAASHNNLAIGTINTLILITSSATVALALLTVQLGRARLTAGLLLFSIGCGLVFLVLKGVEYRQHFSRRLLPRGGLPKHGAAKLRCEAFLHALFPDHRAPRVPRDRGAPRADLARCGGVRGEFGPDNQVHFELGTLYWHLVDVIWIFVWPLLYLLHR